MDTLPMTASATSSTMVGPTFSRVISAGATDRGRVRENNQDQFVIAELTRAMHIQASSLPQSQMLFGDSRVRGHLFIVADGMGGHKGGEEASALAIVSIEDFLLRALHWFFRLQGDAVLNEFQVALRTADERVFAEAQRRPGLRGMGTTVTLAYVVGQVLYVVHAGDSRLYLLRGGQQLYQLTQDHTLVGELVRNKVIDPETASQHPMRNVITQSVGGDTPGVQPEVNRLALAPNDTLLLCTDGLSEMLSDDEIAEVLRREEDPQRACDLLVVRANEKGGPDNVTAVVAKFY